MQDRLSPQLAGAFGATPDALLLVDTRTARIVEANAAAVALLGRERARLFEMRLSDLHEHEIAELMVFSEAVLDRGRWWTRTLSAEHAAGHRLRLEYFGAVVDPPQGTLMLLVLSDLDARRRRDIEAEADEFARDGIDKWRRVDRFFQQIERQNQLILRAAGEGIYGVNAEGRTTFVNPAAERMLGWRSEELVGQDMHTIVHHHHADGSHYPSDACPIYAAFRQGVVHQVDDEVFWRKDGTPFWVEYTSTPIRDEGQVVGAVIVFRDVSQRREAGERLREAMEEVDRLRQRLEQENAYLQEEIRLDRNHRGIVGVSAAIRKTLSQVELVARTDATVLITGESGTGKELIARAIHEASDRRDRPLIRVNCAAVPRELFESEFFGHVRGAFTGALRDRIGRFELADGGTLFLDEVGEIPLELQGKLLRVLQEGQFERVGEERTRKVDVRVIAATNRDVRTMVREGRFREDLYFRLDVFPIESMPLRERRDDIPHLALHFLRLVARRLKGRDLTISEGDMRRLAAYGWPGNVRELQNVIERGAILSREGRLRITLPDDRPAPERATPPAASAIPGEILTESERRERDRTAIRAALVASGGKVSGQGGAAELLGVRPTTLASRIKALGIRME